MVNKLQFNNWITSNKKAIEQSRVQTINKLVQKTRKLDAQLAKRPENVKTKERLRKTVEIMNQLKKQKGLEVMKQVLVLDKEPSAIITDGRATPEEVAIALLAINKSMVYLVKIFKEQFSISDEDDNWKDLIMQASKRRLKLIKTEEKRRKRAELKEQKALGRKRLEWLQENKSENKEFSGNQANNANEDVEKICTFGNWKIEIINEERVKQKLNAKIKPTDGDKLQKDARKQNSKNPVSKGAEKRRVNITEKPTIAVQVLEAKQGGTKGKEMNASSSTENLTEMETHVVDPFFITDKGINYLSTAVVQHGDKQQEEKRTQFNESKSIASLNAKSMSGVNKNGNSFNKEHKHNAKHLRENTQIPKKRSKYTQNPTANQQLPAKRSRGDFKPTTLRVAAGENQLHPSWVAKLKFKPIISDTQAKKIVFDDDLNPAPVNEEIKTKSNTTRRGAPTQTTSAENLHPSWLAKQKLKPTITAFQGKKITFEYD